MREKKKGRNDEQFDQANPKKKKKSERYQKTNLKQFADGHILSNDYCEGSESKISVNK